MTNRTSIQIINGILERIPDSAPEKNRLVARFKDITGRFRDKDPRYLPPEVFRQTEGKIIKALCEACAEVLGDQTTVEWKEKVSLYLRTGR
ncbi:hypothetical protein A2482_02100 [Candidatus Falkowbacteria bacterium RIFOXYC2_FULL_48_21]|uniref:Uncharacterized protein n=1 Tax=Candidatus Falkowbacteria bacterium RIFOXYC2_FULL_48_21 TaxID=1798005 RepID=A0A1F5T6Z3_9BACT|nr:MAG: hypothetical protein A2482_02100 [Candidatus Falkowbacteria bacterium RIFOXYC2_FULL_48_21]